MFVAVDLPLQHGHAALDGARDQHVVDGDVPLAAGGRPRASAARRSRSSPASTRGSRSLSSSGLHRREEADAPEVDADDGRAAAAGSGAARAASSRRRRAPPRGRPRPSSGSGSQCRRAGCFTHSSGGSSTSMPAPRATLATSGSASRVRLASPWVITAMRLTARASVPTAARARASASRCGWTGRQGGRARRGQAGTRGCRPGPDGCESQASTSTAPRSAAYRATSSQRTDRTASSCTTPPRRTSSRPASNCGLTSTTARHGRRRAADGRAEHEPQRDERDVGDEQVAGERQVAGRELARVGALEHA